MAVIAQYLGHRSSKITEEVYARYSPTYLKTASQALEMPTAPPARKKKFPQVR